MMHDLRFTLRSIWRGKLFALTALVAFSFGIGATVTIFSVMDAVLLRPASFPDPGSIVDIQAEENKQAWGGVAPWAFERLQTHGDLFRQVAGFRTAIFTVTGVPAPDQVFGLAVSGNFFPMLGARPWRGRMLGPGDDKSGAPPAVLLSYRAWQTLFAGDPAATGKTVQVDGSGRPSRRNRRRTPSSEASTAMRTCCIKRNR